MHAASPTYVSRSFRSSRARAGALGAAAALALTAAVVPTASAVPGPSVEQVVGGLSNPRGVEIGDDGSIYVAEAGAGGPTLAEALIEGEPSFVCVGDTGGVTIVDKRGNVSRIGGMPSLAGADMSGGGPSCEGGIGFAATGPHDVAAAGRGTLATVIGLGGNVEVRDQIPEPFGPRFGTLESVRPNGKTRPLADIALFEESDPNDDDVDSNPYGVAFLEDGSRLIADAGGNSLVRAWPNGSVDVVATFGRNFDTTMPALSCPTPPFFPPAGTDILAQAVPTSVAVHEGTAYVGFLGGFPFTPGQTSVKSVDLTTGAVSTVATGLTGVVGVDVASDGTVYAVEFAREGVFEAEFCGNFAGRLVEIVGGVVTEIPVPGLQVPGGVAVADDGTIYVTSGSIFPGGGELLAVRR